MPSSLKTWCQSAAPPVMTFAQSGSMPGNMNGYWANVQQQLPGMIQPIVYPQPTPEWYAEDVIPEYKGKFDPDKKCGACDCADIDTKFMRNVKYKLNFIPYGVSPKNPMTADVESKEEDRSYMLRTCRRCGYTWHEIPLYLVPKIMEKKMTGGRDESK